MTLYNSPVTLANDSPGFYGSLRSLLEPEDLKRLEQAYSLAVPANSSAEPELNRPEGASYNPRPARVAAILLKECGETDCRVLGAAMLACGGCRALSSMRAGEDQYIEEIELAESAIAGPQFPHKETERISLALKLDEVRHLHLRKDLPEQTVFDRISSAASSPPRFSENSRLKDLLQAALERYFRYSGARAGPGTDL